jgi:hypothetical protein
MRWVGLCWSGWAMVALTSCGGGNRSASPTSSTAVSTPDAGPPPGYLRFTTAPVSVAPGTSGQWMQWVQAPLDHDVDVVDIQGKQSVGGHHAVLYSTTNVQPIGTVQVWQDSDVTSAHFLGGIGGEGGSALKLPEGAIFRLRAGQALALQVHYLNPTAQTIEGSTELDVKLGTTSPSDQIASLLTNTALSFQVPASGKLHVDVSCTLTQDASVLMITNHLHQWGTAALTQLVDGAGNTTVLKSDPQWNAEWTTNPDYTKYTVTSPLLLKAGDTIQTACDWTNTTDMPLTFPSEMCVFIGFYLGDSDVGCIDNGALGAD